MAHHSPLARRHLRRNWFAFFGDYVFFGLGLTFASVTTTLPAFAATLTDDKVLIGAVSAVWTGGWLLPQVLAANFLSNKERKYPIMLKGMAIGRPIFPLFVVWLMLGGVRFPALTLVFFLGTLGYFAATDALVGLAWFDLMGKTMSAQTRAKLIGLGQAVTGLAAIGAGAWIQWVLGPQGPGYPTNYVLIFGLASFGFGLSAFSNAFIIEPPEAVSDSRPNLRDYLPQLARLWQRDHAFRRVTVTRLLAGLGGLATTFYVVYATDHLRLPESSIGWFATAATIGGAIAGLFLGWAAGRWGSQRVIQITCWVEFAIPIFALLCASGVFGSRLPIVFPILYFLLGVFESSIMLGFLNFILEIAPPGERPTYMGLTNTLAGIMVIIPLVGGFILEYTSYTFLFLLAAVGTLAGALLALTLPNPQPAEAPAPLPDSHVAAPQAD